MIITPREYSTVRLGVESGSSYRRIESSTIRGQPYTPVMFFSKQVYKNCLNVLIELWPNPGLV